MRATDNKRLWFVADAGSDRIRFTATGHQALATELASAGIDIRHIRTRSQAQNAMDVLSEKNRAELAALMGQDPPLDAILAPLFERESCLKSAFSSRLAMSRGTI